MIRSILRALSISCVSGLASFLALWTLMLVKTLHPVLLLPLRAVNRPSCALLGCKLIPDGAPSTLFVSANFFLVGALLGLLWSFWSRPDSGDSSAP